MFRPITLTLQKKRPRIFPVMLVSVESLTRAEVVDSWIMNNFWGIVEEMKEIHRINTANEIIYGDEPIEQFRIHRRSYSEMPICDYIWPKLNPPSGYKIVSWEIGRVNILKPITKVVKSQINHTYAQNTDDGSILCITPGQFVEPTNPHLFAGDRLKKLKIMAPDLISLYPDGIDLHLGRLGIGVLLGSREEIREKLNLDYTRVGRL